MNYVFYLTFHFLHDAFFAVYRCVCSPSQISLIMVSVDVKHHVYLLCMRVCVFVCVCVCGQLSAAVQQLCCLKGRIFHYYHCC